jgi:hypothetical protein
MACAKYLMFSLPPMLTRVVPSLWTHISMFHINLTRRHWDMLMSLLKRSTIVIIVAMMLAILAISPHPKLFSSFFFFFFLALVCCVVVSSYFYDKNHNKPYLITFCAHSILLFYIFLLLQVHEGTISSRLEERSLSSSSEKNKILSTLVKKLMRPAPSRNVLPPPLKTLHPFSPQK